MAQTGLPWRQAIPRVLRRVAAVLLLAVLPVPAGAELADHTHLLDIHAGSPRSDILRDLRAGGYELAGGGAVRFRDWYRPRLPDLTVLFLTQTSDRFGVIWGLSSGERGVKYRIDPALHLGLVWQAELFPGATLSLRAQAVLGGRLRERSCTADYGIFGVAEVNCRLAAAPMPPEETLGYLLDVRAERESTVSVLFEYRF
ncbi:MAG: hypothetical protein Q27BPR15_01045 [Rhodobacter sp. CACIA14H1]|nr:MAG: hypothetical protein Q27BPR15_01045 [Rhodobacter sp. CACIA14H1]